ncbi:hypothetical protein [Roseobacter sp. HKCCD7870]|uniref:hypothetical protein n=1 Tax=Roseobacter sp. HKCCD7870 TaxID=3120343 RepID=UPI0030ECC591
MAELPEFYFRVRENTSSVFRVDTENHYRRIEMHEIAMVNIRNGNIKAHGAHELTADETTAITQWMEARRAPLKRRDLEDIHRTIDHLNETAHWAQSRADDADLEDFTDRLLLAMHDLRSVLVRKKAERVNRDQSR